jgi:hypothetical protein
MGRAREPSAGEQQVVSVVRLQADSRASGRSMNENLSHAGM